MKEEVSDARLQLTPRALATNSFANAVLVADGIALALPRLLNVPEEVALAAIPLTAIAGTMKVRSLKAYSKTIHALEAGADTRGGISAQRLAAKVVGPCAYVGMRTAFKDHFGEKWKEEFSKLNFQNFAYADNKY